MLISEAERFVEEDLGGDDASCIMVPEKDVVAAVIAEEDGILAGLEEAREILGYFRLSAKTTLTDGDKIKKGDRVIEVAGSARSVLRAERLVLNFLSKMSGIATLTGEYAKRAGRARIACTRKTTPGFRKFEKKAVRIGGGDSHRFNLSDAVIVKDNHLKIMGMEKAFAEAKKAASFTQKIEVEVESTGDALKAAGLGCDIIMFDNMPAQEIKEALSLLREKGFRGLTEASGGINLGNIGEYSDAGVDVISVGALTHSPKSLGFRLDIEA